MSGQPFSPGEYSEVERFGLHKPDGLLALEHVAYGFAIVVVAAVVIMAVIVGLLLWVTS